jgi:hypothetical protein
MVLELSGTADKWSFYNQAFPSDLRIDRNGQPVVGDFPVRSVAPLLTSYVKVIEEDTYGFSPESPIYMRFDGEYEAEDLNFPADPGATLLSDSPVQLLDVDPDSPHRGQRYPIEVTFNYEADEYRPASLLQARPVGTFLNEDTTYALIVTRNAAAEEYRDDLEPNAVLNALLEGRSPRDEKPFLSRRKAQRAMDVFAPLVAQLAQEGIAAEDVIGATVWTTGSPSLQANHIADAVYSWDIPALTSEWTQTEDMGEYCVLKADWTVPGLQKGLFPYPLSSFGGDIRYDDNGNPEIQYERAAQVVVTIPKTTMPSEGWPLLLYHHGTQGTADQVWDRGYSPARDVQTTEGSTAQVAAIRGWAAAGMDGHFGAYHQAEAPLLDWFFTGINQPMNLVAYNFLNPKAMRDNLLQQLAERVLYRRLLNTLELDPSLCPGADAGSRNAFIFDPQMQAVSGQSLGSFTSVAQAAADPEPLKALIPTGSGVYDINLILQILALGGDEPLGMALEPVFFGVDKGDIVNDPAHPFYALSSNALATSNTGSMMAEYLRGGNVPMDILTFVGHLDDWVTIEAQTVLLRSMEADMAGPELDVPADESLLNLLQYAGTQQISFPVSSNAPDGSLNAFVRYREDGIMTGHHVAFQYEEARHQFGCVLQDVAAGLAPVIVAGDSLRGDCASGAAPVSDSAPH